MFGLVRLKTVNVVPENGLMLIYLQIVFDYEFYRIEKYCKLLEENIPGTLQNNFSL